MRTQLSDKLARFTALRPNEESLHYQLFHHKNLAGGALSAKYTFFNVPIGAQDPDTGAQASEEDTNMTQSGLLSAPNRFFATKIHVAIAPPTTDLIPVGDDTLGTVESFKDDVSRLVNRGVFTMTLLNKEYVRVAPLGYLGAGYGVYGALAAASTVAATTITNALVTNGMPTKNEGFTVALPLETQTAFSAAISFPKATLTTAVAVRLGVVLDGILYRPEQ